MLLCPWDFAGKSTGVGFCFLLQRIFLIKGLNSGLPHCKQMLYHLSYQGSLDSILKSRDITWLTKIHIVKAMVFPGSHVWMWELDHKEGWLWKDWCFQTVVLEKTLKSPLDSKEIKPVNLKENQPWIFIGRTDPEFVGHLMQRANSLEKDSDAGKDWGQKEKWAREDEMFGWHNRINGHEFVQTPGDGEGQGSLACCSPWNHKE